jgi:hypothetical protein
MSSTLTSKGYKKPNTGDRATWWDDLNYNTQRLNDHTHDGSDSQALSTSVFTKGSLAVSSASWAAVAGQNGTYRQLCTHPTGYSFPTACMTIYDSTTGNQLFLSVEKASASTFYLYVNDNTLNLVVKYA